MAIGQPHGVAPAHREADEQEVFQFELSDEGVQIATVSRRRIIAIRRPAAVAMSPLVEGDNPIVMLHRGGKVGPGVRRLSDPMQEQQRRSAPLAPLEVAQSNFRRLYESLLPARNRQR